MTYSEKLDLALERLHDEGRYRTFIDIERRNGSFPHAVWTKPDGSEQDITVWCGNDYLGMGQNEVVRAAMHEAIEAAGAGSGGHATFLAPPSITNVLRRSWPICTEKRRRCCSPPHISQTMRR